MLYKKYHRSYVKQFKKGMKLEYKRDFRISMITKEPFISKSIDHGKKIICIVAAYYNCIVLPDSKLNTEVYVV